EEALRILGKAIGLDHPDYARSLHNFGNVYREQVKYTDAELSYKQALSIYENVPGPDHPDKARSLEAYSELLRKTQRNTEAAQMEARAEAIRAKHALAGKTGGMMDRG